MPGLRRVSVSISTLAGGGNKTTHFSMGLPSKLSSSLIMR